MTTRTGLLVGATLVAVLAVAACTSSDESASPAAMERDLGALPTLPPVEASGTDPTASADSDDASDDEPTRGTLVSLPPAQPGAADAAMIDADGQLGLVRDGVIANDWVKFDAFPSPDRSTAVLTLGPHIGGIGPERPMHWVSLPDGRELGEQVMRTGSQLTATSLDGTVAGFTTLAPAPVGDAIAGVRSTSRIEIVSRDAGTVFDQELDGNFVPEAFSSRLNADGLPALAFLLEYVPADAPRFYRVRVLDTETGEVSLPLNLRNKQQQIDERMAGFTRSQVVAESHGLLFTLYRGTVDGTPDGEPYAFVHTLDVADGVWCLDVDPALELNRHDGSLAVGGDRLYVASANGRVGSFLIPSIADPDRSPTMEWVTDTGAWIGETPEIAATSSGIVIADPDRPGLVVAVAPDGARREEPVLGPLPGRIEAFDPIAGDKYHAIGHDWTTFGDVARPDWLDEIEVLVVG